MTRRTRELVGSASGATLAVGEDIARSVVLTRLGAVILGLVTVLVPLAVVTNQARSRTRS